MFQGNQVMVKQNGKQRREELSDAASGNLPFLFFLSFQGMLSSWFSLLNAKCRRGNNGITGYICVIFEANVMLKMKVKYKNSQVK